MTTPQSLLPHLSAPVERTITGAASLDAASVEQSIQFPVHPFAGDDDE
ncbi:hypothetical protein NE236_26415 [Actinoallomurus purpureus]|nr:hypothetical protein [Actinoallomurus purpureus]MCO6008513.1 hypothetical protein [Actinoallomurus purpureus]